LFTSGVISAAGSLSAVGSIEGGNLFTPGAIISTGNITGGNLLTPGAIISTGNITGGNISTAGRINTGSLSLSGNVTSALNVTGNVTALNIAAATLSLSGNVTANYFVGNGSQLTGLPESYGNANVAAYLPTYTGNLAGGNVIVSGTASVSSITKTGSNSVGNIGQIDNAFNTVFATATSAQYADLAEMYCADAEYAPGTVLSFGGSQEVTISSVASDARVAGVVSTNPAHLMNSTLDCDCAAALALTGRVPTQVTGTVRKGDMMISAGNGRAQACATPAMGTVIGKALEDFEGATGTIEIVVGRL
jgi:hypothetical protein